MSDKNKTIVINKHFATEPQTTIHFTKKQLKAVKWMKKRFIEDGLLTTIEDLQQFVRSRSSQGSKTAARKFASRLVDSGAAERFQDGIFIPAGYRNLVKDIDIKTLSKIKSKRERNTVFKAQNQFLSFVKPIVANTQNKWSLPLIQPTIKFKVDGLYDKIKELNLIEKHDKYYLLSFKHKDFPYLKIAFHIYRNKVILKLGDPDCPLHASESIILTAISTCHKYLIWTNEFWNLDLEIPSAHEWLINIHSIYTITINPDYSKFGKCFKDKILCYELNDNGNCLLLRKKISLTQLKPVQFTGLFNKYNPLKILDLEPLRLIKNQSQNVTFSNEHENDNFSKMNSICHTFENFQKIPNFNESNIIGEKV